MAQNQAQNAWLEIVQSVGNGSSSFPITVAKWLSDPAFHIESNKSALAQMKDTAGITLLHFAAFVGDESTVKLLLTHGADIHARNSLGETPADDARSFEHPAQVHGYEEVGLPEQIELPGMVWVIPDLALTRGPKVCFPLISHRSFTMIFI